MKRSLYLTQAGIIAALYVVLTYFSSTVGLSSGVVQCRLSEALCLLPIYTPAAIPGVTVGCFISNLITSGSVFDITLGSVATLIGATGAYLLRKGRLRYFASLPTVLANAIAVPIIIKLMSGVDEGFLYIAATVALGEIISCSVFGGFLTAGIAKCGLAKYLIPNKKRNFN